MQQSAPVSDVRVVSDVQCSLMRVGVRMPGCVGYVCVCVCVCPVVWVPAYQTIYLLKRVAGCREPGWEGLGMAGREAKSGDGIWREERGW
jgi:hypothetical protein